VFSLRKFYAEQMFVLLHTKRMQLRNHVDLCFLTFIQPRPLSIVVLCAKRLKQIVYQTFHVTERVRVRAPLEIY